MSDPYRDAAPLPCSHDWQPMLRPTEERPSRHVCVRCGAQREGATTAVRHFIESPTGPVEIEPFTFAHGGPRRSCDACLALVERDGRLIHAAGCGAAKMQPRIAASEARVRPFVCPRCAATHEATRVTAGYVYRAKCGEDDVTVNMTGIVDGHILPLERGVITFSPPRTDWPPEGAAWF